MNRARRQLVRRILPVLSAWVAATCVAAFAHAQTPPADPYIWLEDVSSPRAMDWVHAENAKTLKVLQGDPRFAGLFADALTLAQAKDRIPYPELIGDQVYNLWRDAAHVRGVWRRTSKADYAMATPHWTTVLDLDALATAEHANWVSKGANCLPPAYTRCLIALSDGGEDAVTEREFDLTTDAFVPGGFVLPHSKQSVDWLDADTLLVARDWGAGTMTASGYPFVVKMLKRGQSLDQATEVFRGQPSDVEVDVNVMRDGDGNKAALILRGKDFFHSDTLQVTSASVAKLPLPEKLTLDGLVHNSLIYTTNQDWSVDAAGFKTNFAAGSLLSYDLGGPTAVTESSSGNQVQLNIPVATHLIFAPGPRQSVDQAVATRSRVTAAIYDNVKGAMMVFDRDPSGAWTSQPLPVAPNSSVGVVTASDRDDSLYYDVSGFLDPSQLFQADAATGAAEKIKALPPRFDASKDMVEQFEATSSDGTKIPYFIVRPKGMKLDGTNPTILYAYGGFGVSETPFYSANIGKLWLERGGVFVLANIRGGGEFGPAWHDAGLKTHRQIIYDDFAAVGRDLIARGVTSPRRLGIQGGSNGGLLMGVEFTQHPELWHAVDIQVPLLDMLRFEKIAAGASWVGEYGSIANPDEAAFLAKISPYNNLKPGVAYPEPLIWTTTKDDRVGPQHARKFAAKLSAMGVPYLFYEVIEGGHGSGANLEESARTNALEMTYFIRKLMD
jgi:prolyl oligopeptidase